MPQIDVFDTTFVVGEPRLLRTLLCDETQWKQWFPDLVLECFCDRGPLGKRWVVRGALSGTAEIWLEPFGDGTIVHAFLQADRSGSARASRREARVLHRRYAVPLKRRITAVKDEVERGRSPGEPRVRTPRARTHAGDDILGADLTAEQLRAGAAHDEESAMANQTTSDIVIDAAPAPIMAIIADFKSYPTWATGVQETEVLSTGVDGRAEEVRFVLDASPIRDEYSLAYEWNDDSEVSWSLSEPGKMLRAMDGSYVLDLEAPERTRVTYRLAVDVSIPLLGMLKRKAEKVIIDTALSGLKKRVEQGA